MKVMLKVFCDGLQVADLNFTTHDDAVLAYVNSEFEAQHLCFQSPYCATISNLLLSAAQAYPEAEHTYRVEVEGLSRPPAI